MLTRLRRWTRGCPGEDSLRDAIEVGLDASPIIAEHLEQCADCRERFGSLRSNADVAKVAIGSLGSHTGRIDTPAAFQTLIQKAQYQCIDLARGEAGMNSFWNRRGVRAASAASVLLIIVMLVAISPVGSAAGDVLDRFRVRKFAAITINESDFSEFGLSVGLRLATSDMDSLEAAVEDLVSVETTFNTDDLESNATEYDTLEEAETAYGPFAVPGSVPDNFGAPEIYVTNAGTATATVDTANLQAIIDELQLPIFSIPDASAYPELVFSLEVPKGVVLHYQSDDMNQHLVVAQMTSPTLVTPDGLDMNELREDLLALPGLPPDFVAQLRSIQDWEDTLIIPIPDGASSKDVTVQGQPGLLITSDNNEGSAVIWEKNGTLFVVAGTLSEDAIRDIAGSLD